MHKNIFYATILLKVKAIVLYLFYIFRSYLIVLFCFLVIYFFNSSAFGIWIHKKIENVIYQSYSIFSYPVQTLNLISKDYIDDFFSKYYDIDINKIKKILSDKEKFEIDFNKDIKIELQDKENSFLNSIHEKSSPQENRHLKFLKTQIVFLDNTFENNKAIIKLGNDYNLQLGNAVIFNNQIIGVIYQINDHYSVINLINSNKFKIPIIFTKTNLKCMTNGNVTNSTKILLSLSCITNENDLENIIEDGEEAFTLEQYNIMPYGIKVGKAKKIQGQLFIEVNMPDFYNEFVIISHSIDKNTDTYKLK